MEKAECLHTVRLSVALTDADAALQLPGGEGVECAAEAISQVGLPVRQPEDGGGGGVGLGGGLAPHLNLLSVLGEYVRAEQGVVSRQIGSVVGASNHRPACLAHFGAPSQRQATGQKEGASLCCLRDG